MTLIDARNPRRACKAYVWIERGFESTWVREVVCQVLQRPLHTAGDEIEYKAPSFATKRAEHCLAGSWSGHTQFGMPHLASDDGLHEEAEHREHGETAVLELLHLRKHR